MTGPEHYLEAERLLELAVNEPEASALTATYIAEAQVHATLALTAATAAGMVDAYSTIGRQDRRRAWVRAVTS